MSSDEYNECPEIKMINRNPNNIDEAKKSKENYYYWIRNKYNNLSQNEKNDIIGSSMFIFLNKTCFRGLFRVGPNGFNVPYGNYKNPEIINKSHLDEIHLLIKHVKFECLDFNKLLLNYQEGDFIYLDPPYVPESITSFVGYTEKGFDIDAHKKLFALIHGLTKNKIKIMLSNSDVKFIHDNFNDDIYTIESFSCKRTINSKNPKAKTNEVIIINY